MCVISIALSNDSTTNQLPIKFICLLNRDEQLCRTTQLPNNDTNIISAIDSLHGGTSNGFNKQTGIYVALLNYFDPTLIADNTYISRGLLVNSILNMNNKQINELFDTKYHTIMFNHKLVGFNMIVVKLYNNTIDIRYITNRLDTSKQQNMSHNNINYNDNVLHINIQHHKQNNDIQDNNSEYNNNASCILNTDNNTIHQHQYAYIQQLTHDDSMFNDELYNVYGFSNGQINDNRFKRSYKLNQLLYELLHDDTKYNNNQQPTLTNNTIQQLITQSSNLLCNQSYDKDSITNVCDKQDCVNLSDTVLLNNPKDIDAIRLASQMIFVPSSTILHKHMNKIDDSNNITKSIDPNKVWATRSQTILLATNDNVYYYYRTIHDNQCSDWIHFTQPIPLDDSI